MVSLKKLDGTTMYLNEDLIERVENGADGQSAIFLVNGNHVIVAVEAIYVVEKIRSERVSQLRRVFQGPDDDAPHTVALRPPEVKLFGQAKRP